MASELRRRALLTLAAAGCAVACAFVAHAALDALALRIEREHGACLWGDADEHRDLLVAGRFDRRGRDWLLLIGASEDREAFLPDVLASAIESGDVRQLSHSMATFSSVLLSLEYLAQVYGPEDLPRHVVVGLSPRLVCNVPADYSPMFDAIDRFSPAVRVDRAAVELVPKNLLEGLWSRARFRAQQGRRYKSALLALWRLELAPEVRADLAGAPLPLDRRFTASRYHHRAHVSHDAVLARLAEPSTNLRVMVDWDYSQNSGVIHEQFARLRRFASAHEIALYAVLMPERSEVRALYGEGVWERYAELVRASLIDTPLLDLREFLRDDEFFDATHADVHGARRVSERVARFVAAGGEVQ